MRARRFALPALTDDRTDAFIEGFLSGRGRAAAVTAVERSREPLRRLPGRLAWEEALQRESQRTSRYGTAAAVAVLELRPMRPTAALDSWLRLHVAPLGEVLLTSSRSTDTVARVTATRFQVLLPETGEDGASEFVDRIVRTCEERLTEIGAPLTVKSGSAASSAEVPLPDALARALEALEAA